MSILHLRDPNTGKFVPVPCLIGPKGDKGEQGLNWRGAWTQKDTYVYGDAVYRTGSAYVCTAESVDGLELPEESTNWSLLASKGDTGDRGADGYTPVRSTDYWTADDIAAMEKYIDSAVTDTFGKGTSIPSGADLNTYTTIGKYYASSNSSAQSLVNSPTTRNFMMYVFTRTTDDVPSQLIIDLVGQMYLRSRSTSSWGSWVTYITKTDLTSAVTSALQDAKDSGEFDGQRGTCLIAVTTTPSAYTTEVNGLTPAYRIALSTVTSQGGVTEVKVGDVIQRSYYHYPVIYVDASYAYCKARVSIRGATGAAGTTPVKGTDYFTDADKTELVGQVKSSLPTLTITGVDENDVAHTWLVYGVSQ